MKKLFSSLFSVILFFCAVATSLLGQQVHVGTQNQYPIGNSDVSTKIFLFFLQQQSIQGYADDPFMTSPDNWLGNAKASIQYTGKAPNYTYSIILGHEEDVIDGVNSADIQNQFNGWYANWMNNPTRQEVSDYFSFKSLAYFWAHDGQKITPTPTVYFDDQGHNVTMIHQFLIRKDAPNPNHDHPVVGADAIGKCYDDAANKIAAQYPNATSWQASRHECPIFMNGRIRLWQVQSAPSGTIFDLLNLLLEEKNSSSLQIMSENVAQAEDGFDFSPFNSSAPIPASFMVTVCYDDVFLGVFHDVSKDSTSKNESGNTIGNLIKGGTLKESKSPEAPSFDPTTITTHGQFGAFFNITVVPNFIDPAIIKFSSIPEIFSQMQWGYAAPVSINGVATIIDPTKGWMRDTHDWDLFGVMYDALDLQGIVY
ncbi:MAG: hypothetical protein FJ390_08125 [Verrucomicrobia bacterium]|nr:hypothetical protein [Verrucomicrobiota bacterium]